MRRSLFPLLTSAIALTAPVLGAQEARPGAATVRADTLPNGLAVIVVENHAVPVATAHLVFRGGALTQTPSLQGVPHLLEHMLFKAYRGQTEDDGFARQIDMLGGEYNGATGDESVSYTLWLPSRSVGDGLARLAQLVRDPDFLERELRTERFVVRNEMSRDESQPTTTFRKAMRSTLWGRWWSRKNTIGDEVALFAATVPLLTEYYRRWYVPDNAALVVVGDVEAARVVQWAQSSFGRWKRGGDPFRVAPPDSVPPLDSVAAFVFTRDVPNLTVEVRWRGPRTVGDSTDAVAAALLATLFSDAGSPTREVLVHADGPFDEYSLTYDGHARSGEFVFRGTTTLARLQAGLDLLVLELDRLPDPTFYSAEAIAAASKRERVDEALLLESSPSIAQVLGEAWATHGIPGALRAATPGAGTSLPSPEALASIARRWITGRPFVAGVLATPAEGNAAAERLGRFVDALRATASGGGH
jgi:zinc protease